MEIAVIQNNTVKNIIVCDTLELAQQLLPDTLCVDGEGLTIGAKYDDTLDEPDDTPPDPDADRDAMLVDMEYRLTLLELGVN